MGNTISVDKDFDFKDIFPTCMNDYYSATQGINEEDLDKPFEKLQEKKKSYYDSCTEIDKKIVNSQGTFIVDCQNLSLYLDHIKTNTRNNQKASCIYFSYKLKDFLKRKGATCGGEKNCYEIMKNKAKNDHMVLFDICKDHVVDISDSTYYIMEKLIHLYDQCLFLTYDNDCNYGIECYEIYRDLLLISQNGNNNSFKDVLENFKDKYNSEMKTRTGCESVPKILHSHYGGYARKAFLASFLVIILISITTFILYKYTKYSIYLQPFVLRLQILWRNQDGVSKLSNLFETENTKLTHKYNILYNSLE
ncbi:variable surface protein [Plasmodium gonderi]|uniref:Variable surface protein n=1 Tax=Plasmodium gonderi TaxID=77519 RepID=A0A1Y1JT79_PLAGO|nr:variable surface protein [Plasmodium gonderi]GAW83982.1 variable surface protein [Plasmodium gonderi]